MSDPSAGPVPSLAAARAEIVRLEASIAAVEDRLAAARAASELRRTQTGLLGAAADVQVAFARLDAEHADEVARITAAAERQAAELLAAAHAAAARILAPPDVPGDLHDGGRRG